MEKIFSNRTLKCIVLLLICCLGQLFAAECGDVNGNEEVDIVDALIIAQAYVNLDPANYDPSVADVNADGYIDIVDALLVAQLYVNLITELNCSETPTPTPTPEEVEDLTYQLQAEDATWSSGGVENDHSGYTGIGYVNIDNASGEWIEWSIIMAAGTNNARSVFTYACASDARPMKLIVNGNELETLGFPASGEWTTWATDEALFSLTSGPNTIRLEATTSDGGPNMDKMDLTIGSSIVTPTPTPSPIPTDVPTTTPIGWTPPPAVPLKHWHETKGFGTNTKGGIAGEVYKVTNLNSSGSGSLSDAVSMSNRLVVFEVGGVIQGGFSVASNVTIAGQTAPYPGITTIKGQVRVSGNNIVVSHITHQQGSKDSGYFDAWYVQGSNIVLDHVAVYWGKDETFPVARSNNVTLYKCLVAEGLQFCGHEDGEHSKGLHIQEGDSKVSVISSLQAHCALRGPRIDGGEAFLANWVNYNWGPGWDHEGPKVYSDDELPGCTECYNYAVHAHMNADITLVGSVALWGPETKGEYFLSGHRGGSANGYLEDNIIKDRLGNDLYIADSNIKIQASPAIWPEGMEPLPADEALYEVLRTAGPHPGNRNPHNARIVKDVADGTGEIIDSEDEVGGYPNYSATYRPIEVPDGAEARQAWLDELEDEVAVDTSVDLSRLYNIVGSQASDRLAP